MVSKEGQVTAKGLLAGAAAGTALVGVQLAKWAFEGVQAFSEATSTVRAYQRVTGTTAEDASRLAVAVKMTGTEAKAAQTGFFQLEKRIATGKDTLNNYGIQVAYTRDGSVDFTKTLSNVAEGFQGIEDPAKRNQLVFENFGKGGAALIPLLSKSKDELKDFYAAAEKHHEIFSQEDLDHGREYAVAIRELDAAMEGLKLEVGQAVIPAFTQIATTFTQGIDFADQLANSVGLDGLGGAFKVVLDNLNPLNAAQHAVNAGSELLAGNFGEAGKQALEAIPGIGGYVETLFGGDNASTKFSDAQATLKTKLSEAAGLAAEGKTHTKDYKDAMGEAKGASETLTVAQERLASFFQTTAEKATAAQLAMLSVFQAELALQGSTFGLSDALDNYNKVQAEGQKADETTEQFQRRVAEAHLAVQQQILGVMKAAGDKAAADLGPNATAADRARAATDGQRQALQFLAGQFPGLRAEIDSYIQRLDATQGTRYSDVVLSLPSSGALEYINGLLYAIPGTYEATVVVNYLEQTIPQDFVGSDRNTKHDIRPVRWN